MKTSLKKLVAGASVATLVALNATFLNVNAAVLTGMAVNGGTDVAQNTQVTTIAFTPATALVDRQSFVVSYPADMQDTGFVTADVAVDNAVGGGDFVAGAAVVDVLRNTITVPVTTAGTANSPVTVTLSNSHFATVDAKKNILFVVETKNAAGAVVDKGSLAVYLSDANDVAVTARVAPILNMELKATPFTITAHDDGADTVTAAGHHFQIGDSVDVAALTNLTITNIADAVITLGGTPDLSGVVDNTSTIKLNDPYALGFGTLNIGANTRKMDVETSTNAVSGITVTVASTGLVGDNNKVIGDDIDADDSTTETATDGDNYEMTSTFTHSTAANTAFGAPANPDSVLTTTNVADTQTILQGDNVEKVNGTTTVQLDATIDAFTESGNYSDTLTYTVTGTF